MSKRLTLSTLLLGLASLVWWAAPPADARKPNRKPARPKPARVAPRAAEAPRPEPPRNEPPPAPTVTDLSCASVPTEMVCVTGGTFTMGSNVGDADELPTHAVTLATFYLDRTEVSFGEYLQCVQAGKCRLPLYFPPDPPPAKPGTPVIARLPGRPGAAAARPAEPGTNLVEINKIKVDAQLAVAGVTWTDARAFCEFRGKHLPTEAQWEYSARGAMGHYYAWGSAAPTCDRVASSKCGGLPVRVDAMPLGKSAFGAVHLTGNVWEWVHDWYDPTYYQATTGAQNPMGPTNVQDPATGEWKYRHRGVRGGSFSGIPADLRTTYRFRLLPDMYASDIGFRCAKSSVTPVALGPATR